MRQPRAESPHLKRIRDRSWLVLCAGAALLWLACGEPTTTQEQRLRQHVSVLASEAFAGRATGRAGERLAARYIADQFRAAGLQPEADRGYLQAFEFTSGVGLRPGNVLEAEGVGSFALDEEWRPLSFSETGSFGPAPVVFGGYGFAAPATADIDAVDSYGDVDVTGVWLLVLRDWPENASDAERQHWGRYAGLRYKAILARERGAAGLLVVQRGPASGRGPLIPLRFDGTAGSAGIPAISLSEAGATRLLGGTGHTITALRERLEEGETLGAFAIPNSSLRAEVRLALERSDGVNVVARLGVGNAEAPALVVGAHYDHLGRDARRGSLAKAGERGGIHYGADDNASGVAALIEIARALRSRVDDESLVPVRDVIFAAWSGEELGLLGSNAFVSGAAAKPSLAGARADEVAASGDPHASASGDPHASASGDPHASAPGDPHTPSPTQALRDRFAANLNLDMVGRLRETLLIQGASSSTRWPAIVESAAEREPLRLELQDESLLPTDASSFVTRGVPVLSAFSGAHPEYHTPRDTPDTLNYAGVDSVTRLFTEVAEILVSDPEAPDFVAPRRKLGGEGDHPRRAVRLRAYLGTVPDYATAVEGLALATVIEGGPAQRAGLRGGDVVIELAGRSVRNVYDYTFAIEALRPDKTVAIAVRRDGVRIDMQITPGARD